VPDNTALPSEPTSRFGRPRRKSAVPREVVLGIDDLEKKVSYAAGAFALVLAGIFVPRLINKTKITVTATPGKHNVCQAGYHLVSSLCQKSHYALPSSYVPQFLEIIIIGAVMMIFAVRAKRAGVAVCALLLGLALGTIGFPFVILGAWLIIRAFRLQKYGDASFKGSGKRASEIAKEKKVARASGTRTTSSVVRTVAAPEPSKRYTPKKPPRKKR
jgi:hypothetical protein